ncbi:hypothetical protein L7F22_000256 [Adiantum nelumboides]|nr:hypothetical protein [Adiantum nelumboides]
MASVPAENIGCKQQGLHLELQAKHGQAMAAQELQDSSTRVRMRRRELACDRWHKPDCGVAVARGGWPSQGETHGNVQRGDRTRGGGARGEPRQRDEKLGNYATRFEKKRLATM